MLGINLTAYLALLPTFSWQTLWNTAMSIFQRLLPIMALHMVFALLAGAAGHRAVAADSRRPGSWTPDQTCPTRIRTTITGSSPFSTMAAVHSVLKNCPGLKSLQLRITGFGCSEWPDRESLPLSLISEERYLPSLEVLELEGYAFDDSAWSEVKKRVKVGLLPKYKIDWSYAWGSLEWQTRDWFNAWLWKFANWEEYQKYLSLSDQDKKRNNLDLLLRALDFSQIHTFAIKDPRWASEEQLALLAEALPALRTLTVWGQLKPYSHRHPGGCNCTIAGAEAFIAALPPSSSLQSLTWINGFNCTEATLDVVLDRHGATLEYLQWRNDEMEIYSRTRPVFTAEALRTLGAKAPRLSSLIIDLEQNGTWPVAHLETIAASMPNLTNLTIYFSLGTPESQSEFSKLFRNEWEYMELSDDEAEDREQHLYAQPRLDASAATYLFNVLRNAKSGKRFETVQFRAGDWTRPFSGPLRTGRGWLEQKRAWFRCSKFHRDGTAKKEGEDVCEKRHTSGAWHDEVYNTAEWADLDVPDKDPGVYLEEEGFEEL